MDHEKTSLYRVLELIRIEAAHWGASVNVTEIYGMMPASALLESAAYYLQVDSFDPLQALELKSREILQKEGT